MVPRARCVLSTHRLARTIPPNTRWITARRGLLSGVLPPLTRSTDSWHVVGCLRLLPSSSLPCRPSFSLLLLSVRCPPHSLPLVFSSFPSSYSFPHLISFSLLPFLYSTHGFVLSFSFSPLTFPSHPWLLLDLVHPTLGVRGQEARQPIGAGGTGRASGFCLRDALRRRIQGSHPSRKGRHCGGDCPSPSPAPSRIDVGDRVMAAGGAGSAVGTLYRRDAHCRVATTGGELRLRGSSRDRRRWAIVRSG
jgi:hypothetical protein